jgi:alkanesulfonate monooxygenase
MSIEFFWRLPTAGDGRSLRPDLWNRGDYAPARKQPHPYARTGVQHDGYTYYDLLAQIAGAADVARFDGLWIPQSPSSEDPLIVAAALAREARRLKLVPALRTPLLSAVYSTKIAVSFQRLTGGRLGWNLVNEEDQPVTWHGRHWSLAEQVERNGEFLDVSKGFWLTPPFTYHGKYYEVENGGFAPALQGQTFPAVYLSGETDDAYALSARHADVHMLPLLPPAELAKRIARLNALAAGNGRTLRYAVEADLVARQSDEEAWQDLRTLWDEAAGKTVPISAQAAQAQALPSFDDLRSGEHLWRGFGLVHPDAGTGLVGSHAAIAEQVRAYAQAGVGCFVLAANPGLEEAWRIGEKLLPLLRRATAELQPEAA